MLGVRASKARTSEPTGNRRAAKDVYVDDGVEEPREQWALCEGSSAEKEGPNPTKDVYGRQKREGK
jgi:hypothetical protein